MQLPEVPDESAGRTIILNEARAVASANSFRMYKMMIPERGRGIQESGAAAAPHHR